MISLSAASALYNAPGCVLDASETPPCAHGTSGEAEEHQGKGHAVSATAHFVRLIYGLPNGLGREAGILDDPLFEEDVDHASSPPPR